MSQTDPYDDIRALPHPVSEYRASMSRSDRAAQFAPFAALTGFDSVIAETGRLTDRQPELTQSAKEELDRTLQELRSMLCLQPYAAAVYFCPDRHKAGGACLPICGNVKKLDEYRGRMVFTDGREVPLCCLLALEIL